jgi:hypothetical protein
MIDAVWRGWRLDRAVGGAGQRAGTRQGMASAIAGGAAKIGVFRTDVQCYSTSVREAPIIAIDHGAGLAAGPGDQADTARRDRTAPPPTPARLTAIGL